MNYTRERSISRIGSLLSMSMAILARRQHRRLPTLVRTRNQSSIYRSSQMYLGKRFQDSASRVVWSLHQWTSDIFKGIGSLYEEYPYTMITGSIIAWAIIITLLMVNV